MRLMVVVALAGLAACGSVDADPEVCQEGICPDSRFPFCDADGSIGGKPNACIAVSCTPGDVASCRGDVAITCNATGDDFDMISCPDGCDPMGCISPPEEVDCTTNAECVNPSPICGSQMTCRGCESNGECASTVCESDTGGCTPEATIVYASPSGAGSGDCTLVAPCTLSRATMVASTNVGKILRMLPGAYAENLSVNGSVVLKIVADGASLTSPSKVSVTGGANVDVRGLQVAGVGTTVTCGDTSTAIAKSMLHAVDVTGGLRINRCTVTMRGGVLSDFSATDDAAIDADSVTATFAFASTSGSRLSLRFINSIFKNTGISLGNNDQAAPGSTLTIAFSTFVYTTSGNSYVCNTNTNNVRTERFENNIFFASAGAAVSNVVLPRTCMFANNIMFPQTTVIANNTIADPKLVDVAQGDYHLQTSSPAINTAIPSTGLGTNHDFDGTARPQGAALDIGAFERGP
jgi:hypothetical protein